MKYWNTRCHILNMNKVGKLLTKMSIFANHASPYLEQQGTKIMMKYKIVIFDDTFNGMWINCFMAIGNIAYEQKF